MGRGARAVLVSAKGNAYRPRDILSWQLQFIRNGRDAELKVFRTDNRISLFGWNTDNPIRMDGIEAGDGHVLPKSRAQLLADNQVSCHFDVDLL